MGAGQGPVLHTALKHLHSHALTLLWSLSSPWAVSLQVQKVSMSIMILQRTATGLEHSKCLYPAFKPVIFVELICAYRIAAACPHPCVSDAVRAGGLGMSPLSLSPLLWPRLGAPIRQHLIWRHLESRSQLCQDEQRGHRELPSGIAPALLPEQSSMLPQPKRGWG